MTRLLRSLGCLTAALVGVSACAPSPEDGASPHAAGASTGSGLTGQQARQMVHFHNEKRAEVGSGSVVWSSQIARYAQERADAIARSRRLSHLPPGENPYGENLALGTSYTVLDACRDWYAEKSEMPVDVRIMTPALFARGVGHYTQMVWKETSAIGAGIARFEDDGYLMTVIVCCYDPPGNRFGGAIY